MLLERMHIVQAQGVLKQTALWVKLNDNWPVQSPACLPIGKAANGKELGDQQFMASLHDVNPLMTKCVALKAFTYFLNCTMQEKYVEEKRKGQDRCQTNL